MNISGKISINKKKYGKYDPDRKVEGFSSAKQNLNQHKKSSQDNYEELTGLNDLDTNILNIENIPSESLKLEIQLANTEKKLKKINSEIIIAEKLEIKDFKSSQKLYNTEKRLKNELKTYREKYKGLGIGYRISDALCQLKSSTSSNIKGFLSGLYDKISPGKYLKKNSVYEQRSKVKIAKLLNSRLEKEMSRPTGANSDEIQVLLFKADKLMLKNLSEKSTS